MIGRIARAIGLGVVVACLGAGPSRAGLDQVYEKPPDKRSWGALLSDFVGYQGFTKSYALVVGISNYEHYKPLPTQNDALRMRDFLIQEAGFDYVHVLTDEKATLDRIRELMLDEFRNRVGKNDRFLFYWSGHGEQLQVGDGYRGFLPLAGSPKQKFSSMVSMENLQTWDELIRAEQALFLLDACFSGLAGSSSKAPTRALNIAQLSKPSHHLVSAGTGEEETIAGDKWGGSLFTAAVLDGLRGAADTTTSEFERDGLVSLNELIAYVKTRVEFERRNAGWSDTITPQLRDLRTNAGEFFFLTNEHKVAELRERGVEASEVFEHGEPLPKSAVSSAPARPASEDRGREEGSAPESEPTASAPATQTPSPPAPQPASPAATQTAARHPYDGKWSGTLALPRLVPSREVVLVVEGGKIRLDDPAAYPRFRLGGELEQDGSLREGWLTTNDNQLLFDLAGHISKIKIRGDVRHEGGTIVLERAGD